MRTLALLPVLLLVACGGVDDKADGGTSGPVIEADCNWTGSPPGETNEQALFAVANLPGLDPLQVPVVPVVGCTDGTPAAAANTSTTVAIPSVTCSPVPGCDGINNVACVYLLPGQAIVSCDTSTGPNGQLVSVGLKHFYFRAAQ